MRPSRQLKAVDFDQNSHVLRYKLSPIHTLDDFSAEILKIIGDRAGVFTPRPDRKFVTFGSCFAEKVAEALIRNGGDVYTTKVTEDINSPFNNRLLLRRIFLDETNDFIEEMQANTGADFKEIKHKFCAATDIIFTLGNIFHLAGPNGHQVLITKDAVLMRETFDETRSLLAEIISLLQNYTKARIFVSASPIPISGYMGDEFASVMEADCASKCQLVTAIRSLKGYTYIPTFEIFRWLAAHQHFPTFGAGGGKPRHLWGAHVGIVMKALCNQ